MEGGVRVKLTTLLTGKGWVRAASLKKSGNDRQLRNAAQRSGGWVISGNRGYCHINESSLDDVLHSIKRLRSQAYAMWRRAKEQEVALWESVHSQQMVLKFPDGMPLISAIDAKTRAEKEARVVDQSDVGSVAAQPTPAEPTPADAGHC